MRRLILALLPLALAACGNTGGTIASTGAPIAAAAADAAGVPPPVVVADRTTLDELGMLAAELAYKAAHTAVEIGVDAGLIRGAPAARFADLDSRAYAALGRVRSAYRTGNATSYASALTEAQAAIAGLLNLTGKGA